MNRVLILPNGIDPDDVKIGLIKQCVKLRSISSSYKIGDLITIYNADRVSILETEISHIDRVKIRNIDMSLNGTQLFSILYDRDAPITDDEFAENCGYKSFMQMSNLLNATDNKPFIGNVIHWKEI